MKSIFVSSTFKDMHTERDALMLKAIPELNEFAKDFGQSVRFVDLRWGINNENETEDEANKKVLSVCLREIDETRPYMIILIGERYGWIPTGDLMERAVAEKEYETDNFDKSVTELEIEYGAFSKKGMLKRCLFYFREPLEFSSDIDKEQRATFIDDEPHLKNKLTQLKEKILASGAKVSSYRCDWNENGLVLPADFTDKIVEDVKELFYNEFEKSKNLTWQEKESVAAHVYTEQKSKQFSARHNVLNNFINEIEDLDHRLFIMQGEVGSGKSTMMSKISSVLAEKSEVFFVACGNSRRSGRIEDVQRQIIYRLEELTNKDNSLYSSDEEGNQKDSASDLSAHELTEMTEKLMQQYAQMTQKPLYIMLDALDQLYFDETLEDFSFLPNSVPTNITFIASCTEDFDIPSIHPLGNETKISKLKRLTPAEKPEVIKGILAEIRKELSPEIISAIVTAESSNNPLYLSLMLQRLIMLNSSDFKKITDFPPGITGIHQYMMYVVKNTPNKTSAMSAELFLEAANRINYALCDRASVFIAISRRGLRESDLEELLKRIDIEWNALDFSLFTKYLAPYFIRRDDGRIDFAHKSIREGIIEKNIFFSGGFIVPKSEKERKSPDFMKIINEYNVYIFEHLKNLSDLDRVKVDEFIYHAHKADDKYAVFNYLVAMCDDVMEELDESDQVVEFLKKEKNELNICSRELCTIAEKDMKWVEDVIAFSEISVTGMNFIEYLVQNLMKLYTDKYGYYEDLKNIGISVVKAADKLVENRIDFFAYYAQSRAFWKYGEICELTGDDKAALDYYERDLAVNLMLQSLTEKLTESKKFFELITFASLMECYDKLAAFYLEKEDGKRDYDKVIEYSAACRNTAQKLENNNDYIDKLTAVSYDREAEAHFKIGDLASAGSCAIAANDIFVRVTQTPQPNKVINDVIANYRLLGDICLAIDKKNVEESVDDVDFTQAAITATENFRLAMANAELLMINNGDANDYLNYCILATKYSDACYYIDDIQNAFDYAGKAMAVGQQLFESIKTEDTAEAFKEALLSRLVVYEDIEENGGEIGGYKEFTDIYKEVSSLYLAFGDSEAAYNCLSDLLDLCENLEEKFGDEEHSLLLLEAYKELIYYFVYDDDIENAQSMFEDMIECNKYLGEEIQCILFDVNVMLAAKKLHSLCKDGSEKAIEYCEIIVGVYEKINEAEPSDTSEEELIRWYAVLGRDLILSSDIKGVDYYFKSINLFETTKTLSENMDVLETISVIYENTAKMIILDDKEKAYEFLTKSIDTYKIWADDQKTQEAFSSLAHKYEVLADTYLNDEDYKNAIAMYTQAIKTHLQLVEIAKDISIYETVFDLLRHATVVSQAGDLFEDAVYFADMLGRFAHMLGDKIQKPHYFEVYAEAEGKLAELYEKNGDIEKAKEHRHFQGSAKQIVEFITPKED